MLSPGAALLTVLAMGDTTPAHISSELKQIFEDETFAFCHDTDLALFPLEREYCEVVGKTNDVCPALPEVCKNEVPKDFKWTQGGRQRLGRKDADYGPKEDPPKDGEETDGSGTGRYEGKGTGDKADDGAGKPCTGKNCGSDGKTDQSSSTKGGEKPPVAEERTPPIEIPGWVAGFFRVLFYALIAVLVAVIGYYIFKNLMKGREEKEKTDDQPEAPQDAEEATAAPRGPIETDVDRLLSRARAAAERGDFKQAIEDAYAALLRRLEGDGRIDLHPSRTNGDYVRALRSEEELRQAVRGIASDVESVQFGSAAPNPTLFESVYRRVLPLCGRVATVALLLLGMGSVSSCERSRFSSPAHGQESEVLMVGGASVKKGGATGSGLAAVAEFLAKHDIKTSFVLTKDQTPAGAAKGIVLMPGAKIDSAQWQALRAWVKDEAGTLILAGFRDELREDFGIEYADSAGPGVVKTVAASGYEVYGSELALPYAGRLERTPKRWEPILVRGNETYALLSDNGAGGRIIAFADDRLFANLAMALGDNASYLATLLSRCNVAELEFWDSIRGAGGGAGADSEDAAGNGGDEGAESPLDSIRNARLLPIMLQLLALVLLFVLWKGTRFGAPRDPKTASRRAFADHTRALGLSYARANASRHASGLFSLWAIDRLRERLLGGTRRGLTPLAETIASRTGRPLGEVMQVLVEATGARDEVSPPSSFRHDVAQAHGPPTAGTARDFWIMEELSRYLAMTKSTTEARGRSRK